MYQSVGSEVIELLAKCIDKPLYRKLQLSCLFEKLTIFFFREITGKPVILNLEYTAQSQDQLKEDEVEDLFALLKEIKVYLKRILRP